LYITLYKYDKNVIDRRKNVALSTTFSKITLALAQRDLQKKMQTVIAADNAMTYHFLVTKVSFYFFKFSAIKKTWKN